MKKKIFLGLLTASMLPIVNVHAQTSWQKVYRQILKNPHRFLANDCLYLETYMNKNIQVAKYFLYDLNKDKTPELFLIGSQKYKGFCFAITCHKGKMGSVYYERFDRINKKQKCIITHGHYHGAGGSGVNEYHAIFLTGKPLDFQDDVYIDHFAGNNISLWLHHQHRPITMKKYKSLYNQYVKSSTPISRFKSYRLTNMKGLSKMNR